MAIFRGVPRLSNLGKVSQYVERVADLGKKNLLFRVDIKHLYSIWQLCKSHEEYQLGLIAVNHFYNFGRQLSPEGSNKLFALSMRCGELEESIKAATEAVDAVNTGCLIQWDQGSDCEVTLLEGASDWLRKPPDMDLIYVLISAFISRRDYTSVKRVFKAVRSHWQLKLTSTIYRLCIESMLCLEERPIEEALLVYCDSAIMGTILPAEVHHLMLDAIRSAMKKEQGKDELYASASSTVYWRLMHECRHPASYGRAYVHSTDI
ncbi:hypothetical protein X943_004006 [Babesia divergens]|uniref:Uncharacterized protein n=1 Tax=Babesia divergens TaxID=32595 RepID=A0AAD9LFW3_BABDI|nr:hypothetical protein X943_004006 [Babesia divergens]